MPKVGRDIEEIIRRFTNLERRLTSVEARTPNKQISKRRQIQGIEAEQSGQTVGNTATISVQYDTVTGFPDSVKDLFWDSTTPARLYAPWTGFYSISVAPHLSAAAGNVGNSCIAQFLLNEDTSKAPIGRMITQPIDNNADTASRRDTLSVPIFRLEAGDHITLRYTNNVGSSQTLIVGGTDQPPLRFYSLGPLP